MKSMIRVLILYFIYLVGLIIVFELLLRTFFPIQSVAVSQWPPSTYMLSNNEKMIYELRPNVGDNNSRGLRDKEYVVKKESSVIRVLVVGDSIAYGLGVSKEDTYSNQLEKLLNEDSSQKYEVLNLGVPGYGTVQIVERFKEQGLKYNPDIVIYGYWFNDFSKHGGASWEHLFFNDVGGYIWEGYIQLLERFPWIRKVRLEILNSQILFRSMILYYEIKRGLRREAHLESEDNISKDAQEEIYSRLQKAFGQIPFEKRKFLDDTLTEKNFNDYYSALVQFKQLCDKNAIKLVILSTPVLSDFNYYDYFSLHDYIKQLALHLKVDHVETFSLFKESGVSYLEFQNAIADRVHFSKEGHQLVASGLYQYLKS